MSSITNKRYGKQDCMIYFGDLVKSCDALAYRPLPNGQIPSGVGYEVQIAINEGKPIIELPSSYHQKTLESRKLNYEDTVVWLSELGQR